MASFWFLDNPPHTHTHIRTHSIEGCPWHAACMAQPAQMIWLLESPWGGKDWQDVGEEAGDAGGTARCQ